MLSKKTALALFFVWIRKKKFLDDLISVLQQWVKHSGDSNEPLEIAAAEMKKGGGGGEKIGYPSPTCSSQQAYKKESPFRITYRCERLGLNVWRVLENIGKWKWATAEFLSNNLEPLHPPPPNLFHRPNVCAFKSFYMANVSDASDIIPTKCDSQGATEHHKKQLILEPRLWFCCHRRCLPRF